MLLFRYSFFLSYRKWGKIAKKKKKITTENEQLSVPMCMFGLLVKKYTKHTVVSVTAHNMRNMYIIFVCCIDVGILKFYTTFSLSPTSMWLANGSQKWIEKLWREDLKINIINYDFVYLKHTNYKIFPWKVSRGKNARHVY